MKMTDNHGDSGLTTGTVDTNQPSSQGEGGKQGSVDALKLQSALEAITKKVEEIDARSKALQGDKDRGVVKTNKDVEELKRKIAEIEKYRKAGFDDDSAIEEISFRDSVRILKDQIATLNPASAGNGAVDVAKVISEVGLDAQDPEVVAAFAGKQFTDPRDAELAALKLAMRKANKPQPSDADRASSPISPPSPGKSSADLLADWDKVKKYPTSPEYKAVKAELDKRGWQ
jgi:hypothetical protein